MAVQKQGCIVTKKWRSDITTLNFQLYHTSDTDEKGPSYFHVPCQALCDECLFSQQWTECYGELSGEVWDNPNMPQASRISWAKVSLSPVSSHQQ